MREIKFRFFSNHNNKMYQLTLLGLCSQNEYNPPVYEGDKVPSSLVPNSYRVQCYEDGHVMQYTGLKDKNGVEIYEGDIVKWGKDTEEVERIAKVVFNEFGVSFKSQVGTFYLFNFIYKDTDEHLEVIGNIYENSDLLDKHE